MMLTVGLQGFEVVKTSGLDVANGVVLRDVETIWLERDLAVQIVNRDTAKITTSRNITLIDFASSR